MSLPIYGLVIIFVIGVVNGVALMAGIAGLVANKRIKEIMGKVNLVDELKKGKK